MKRLLFIDDDIAILKINRDYFSNQNYLVDTVCDTESAKLLLAQYQYDCIILDIHMAHSDGLTFCRTIRTQYNTPIIFLSNLTEEEYQIEGFQSGGDDYVTKPYSLHVLELRIQARICKEETPSYISHKGLVLVSNEKQAYLNDHSLQLTANEYEILNFLKSHEGTPFRQEEIYHALWGECFYNTHSIQVMVMRIRKKLQTLSPDYEYIKTQWGKGYVYME